MIQLAKFHIILANTLPALALRKAPIVDEAAAMNPKVDRVKAREAVVGVETRVMAAVVAKEVVEVMIVNPVLKPPLQTHETVPTIAK